MNIKNIGILFMALIVIVILIMVGKTFAPIFSNIDETWIVIGFILFVILISLLILCLLDKYLVLILKKAVPHAIQITSVGIFFIASVTFINVLLETSAWQVSSTSLSTNENSALECVLTVLIIVGMVAITTALIFAFRISSEDYKKRGLDRDAATNVVSSIVSTIIAIVTLGILLMTFFM